MDSLEHIFHCDLIRSLFPAGWRGNLSKCFFLSGGEDEVLLASILWYGIYAHHCAARHSSTRAHIESKASTARAMGNRRAIGEQAGIPGLVGSLQLSIWTVMIGVTRYGCRSSSE